MIIIIKGGRVKQDSTFIKGVNIELGKHNHNHNHNHNHSHYHNHNHCYYHYQGAEIIHGPNNKLTQFAAANKEPLVPIYCWVLLSISISISISSSSSTTTTTLLLLLLLLLL